uniref:Uncharacterized protein n=1 Tax=Arundo donax TaxID=35708 RepID=A0A0A9A056_ARUDO
MFLHFFFFPVHYWYAPALFPIERTKMRLTANV